MKGGRYRSEILERKGERNLEFWWSWICM